MQNKSWYKVCWQHEDTGRQIEIPFWRYPGKRYYRVKNETSLKSPSSGSSVLDALLPYLGTLVLLDTIVIVLAGCTVIWLGVVTIARICA